MHFFTLDLSLTFLQGDHIHPSWFISLIKKHPLGAPHPLYLICCGWIWPKSKWKSLNTSWPLLISAIVRFLQIIDIFDKWILTTFKFLIEIFSEFCFNLFFIYLLFHPLNFIPQCVNINFIYSNKCVTLPQHICFLLMDECH
jgi:hypothetical protein